jgi:hypothetical protein
MRAHRNVAVNVIDLATLRGYAMGSDKAMAICQNNFGTLDCNTSAETSYLSVFRIYQL